MNVKSYVYDDFAGFPRLTITRWETSTGTVELRAVNGKTIIAEVPEIVEYDDVYTDPDEIETWLRILEGMKDDLF